MFIDGSLIYDLMSPRNCARRHRMACETKLALSSTLSCSWWRLGWKDNAFESLYASMTWRICASWSCMPASCAGISENANTNKRRDKNSKNQRDWSECSKTQDALRLKVFLSKLRDLPALTSRPLQPASPLQRSTLKTCNFHWAQRETADGQHVHVQIRTSYSSL